MSNLVPEQRPDKNGKIVTRHIKSDIGGKMPKLSIPAPQRVGVDPIEVLRTELSYKIMEVTSDYDVNERSREGIFNHLKTFPAGLIKAVEQARASGDVSFFDLASRVEKGEPARFISNIIKYSDIYGGDGDQQNSFVRSLDYYPELNQSDEIFAEGSDEDSKARAVLSVAAAIYKHADQGVEEAEEAIRWEPHEYDFLPSPVIGSEGLADYVLKNHERGSDIAKIIKERGLFTLDEIKMVLEHPESSLAEGVL